MRRLIAIISLLMPVGAWAQEVESAPGVSAVEEIVVTARRRAEFLEDTPIAVTALSGNRLRDADIQELTDVRQLVPGLQFKANAVGTTGASQFRLRGVGTTGGGSSFDPGVAVYIDGVYLSRAVSSVLNLIDIQQIEVLRGPQGTLFGKNSVGGAISVTTVKPSPELEGSLFVRPGNFDSVDTRAMLNVPLGETLAARVSVATNNAGGFHRNTLRREWLGQTASVGALAAVRWEPTEDITVDVSGQWNRNEIRGTADRCVVEEGASAPLATPEFLEACRQSRPFRGQHDVHELSSLRSWGIWAVANWELGDLGPLEGLALKSVSGWRESATRVRADADGTELPAIQVSLIGPEPENGGESRGETFMQEMQFSGSAMDGRLNFIAGAFGYWETSLQPQTTLIAPGGNRRGNLAVTDGSNWDWALFTQATADVTDWLSLTAGIRYTKEKKGRVFETARVLPTPGEPQRADGRAVFDAWTPMASIALTMPEAWMEETPVDHLMGYFTYSRGFRGGGFNSAGLNDADSDAGLAPFGPETLDSFEVGLKSIALDQRLTVNLAAFHFKYDDIQVRTNQLDEDENINVLVLNAGAASAYGVELETRAMPLPGLVVNASLGYIDAQYDSFTNAVDDVDNSTIDRAGEGLLNTPSLQTNVGIQMTVPIELGDNPWLQGYLTPRLQWYYQSSERYAGPELRAARQSGYNLLNARLTWAFMDGRARIALWAKNLTDREYFSNAQPFAATAGFVLRTYNRPRSFGAEISYRFGGE